MRKWINMRAKNIKDENAYIIDQINELRKRLKHSGNRFVVPVLHYCQVDPRKHSKSYYRNLEVLDILTRLIEGEPDMNIEEEYNIEDNDYEWEDEEYIYDEEEWIEGYGNY